MWRDCKKCSKWKKHIYWSHMDQTKKCFYKKMDVSSFMKTLDLPNDFHRNFKGQIGETVELKGPSGNVWQVGVIKSTGRITFQYGWKDFVTGNCVEANDLLVFKYSGNSSFQVQIFDSSGCERTSSFFTRREQTEVRESSDSSIEISEGSDHDRRENKMTISSSSGDAEYSIDSAPVRMPRRTAEVQESSDGSIEVFEGPERNACEVKITISSSSIDSGYSIDSVPVRMTRGRARKEDCTSKEPNGGGNFKVPENDHIIFSKKLVLTHAINKKVMKLSKMTRPGNPFFVIVMTPSMATGSCKFAIPAEFAFRHIPQQTKSAVLHYKGRAWPIYIGYKKIYRSFSTGWKQFVQDNNVQEGDLCLFEFMKGSKKTSFEVHR